MSLTYTLAQAELIQKSLPYRSKERPLEYDRTKHQATEGVCRLLHELDWKLESENEICLPRPSPPSHLPNLTIDTKVSRISSPVSTEVATTMIGETGKGEAGIEMIDRIGDTRVNLGMMLQPHDPREGIVTWMAVA